MEEQSTSPHASVPDEAIRKLHAAYRDIKDQMSKVIVGQDEVIDQLLIALFKSLNNGVAECCGWCSNKANAFSTSIPRTSSASKRILRGEVG